MGQEAKKIKVTVTFEIDDIEDSDELIEKDIESGLGCCWNMPYFETLKIKIDRGEQI